MSRIRKCPKPEDGILRCGDCLETNCLSLETFICYKHIILAFLRDELEVDEDLVLFLLADVYVQAANSDVVCTSKKPLDHAKHELVNRPEAY